MHSERECTSNVFLRVKPDISFVLLAKLLADDETKANALIIQIVNITKFSKFLEKFRLIFLAYANTRILYLDEYLLFFAQVWSVNFDEAALVSKF